MRQESRSRIKENSYDDGQHRIRNHIYIEYIVCYHESGYHTIEHNQCKQSRQAAFALIIIFPEQVEIEHEAKHQHADK